VELTLRLEDDDCAAWKLEQKHEWKYGMRREDMRAKKRGAPLPLYAGGIILFYRLLLTILS